MEVMALGATAASGSRRRTGALGLLAGAVLALSGCLGSDYTSIELALNEWDHGWQATVEPDEEFTVVLAAPRVNPDAPWQVADADPAVVQPVESSVDRGDPADPQAATRWVFRFRGVGAGQSSLVLEAAAGGEAVSRVQYTVAVVADACAAGVGVTAPRCRAAMPAHARGWSELDHGRTVRIALDDTQAAVTLTAPPAQPQARWQVADIDESVLAVGEPDIGQARQPGDFDNADTARPDSFLPVWRFGVDGLVLGQSRLAFEAVDDGRRVDVAEFTVEVVQSVAEGDYLAPDTQG